MGAEDIKNAELKALYENLPDTMRLQFDGEGNYGIPYKFDRYIKGEGDGSFTLNGRVYKTQAKKGGLTSGLNGVFSIAGAEKWTYGNHFGNYHLNCYRQNEKQREKLKNILQSSI